MAIAKGTKSKLIEAVKNVEVLSTVSGLNPETVTRKLANLSLDINKTIGNLSQTMAAQFAESDALSKAYDLKKEELSKLHNIELASNTLDDLQAEITNTEQTWAERKAREVVLREREEEEYEYTTDQARRKEEELFQAGLNARTREFDEKERTLQGRETELNDLRTRVTNFPDDQKRAVDTAVAIATNSVKNHYVTEARILAADHAAQQKISAQEIASLRASLETANDNIVSIRAQLDQAYRDNKEIATKAVDGAGAQVLAANMQRVAEAGQNGGKQSR